MEAEREVREESRGSTPTRPGLTSSADAALRESTANAAAIAEDGKFRETSVKHITLTHNLVFSNYSP